MAKIIGIGGLFIKSPNKTKLMDWYRDVLEMKLEDWGTILPVKSIEDREYQVFNIFSDNTQYLNPSQACMINWMVDDLDGLLEKLKEKKIEIIGSESSEYGKFAWINDVDGNKIELWQPPQ